MVFKRIANNTKSNNRKNGKLSLCPLKFEKAVKDILKVQPIDKNEKTKVDKVQPVKAGEC